MNLKTYTGLPRCPFCDNHQCTHFVGWTEDGRVIQLHRGLEKIWDRIQDTDRIDLRRRTGGRGRKEAPLFGGYERWTPN